MVSFDVVDPSSPQAEYALEAYYAELDERFPTGFDPGAPAADHDRERMLAPHGGFIVVVDDAVTVGCGGVQGLDDGIAEVKRMWLDTSLRGAGVGRQLLAELESLAASLGYTTIVLDTNAELSEAIAMYERAGYVSIERYNDNPYAQRWFRKQLR